MRKIVYYFFFFNHFHSAPSRNSSSVSPFSLKLSLMLSIHFLFGLLLFHLPGTSISISLFPTYFSFLRITCPYQRSLLSCTFFRYFLHFYCSSNSFIPDLIQLSSPSHLTQHFQFRHIQSFLLSFLTTPLFCTVDH